MIPPIFDSQVSSCQSIRCKYYLVKPKSYKRKVEYDQYERRTTTDEWEEYTARYCTHPAVRKDQPVTHQIPGGAVHIGRVCWVCRGKYFEPKEVK